MGKSEARKSEICVFRSESENFASKDCLKRSTESRNAKFQQHTNTQKDLRECDVEALWRTVGSKHVVQRQIQIVNSRCCRLLNIVEIAVVATQSEPAANKVIQRVVRPKASCEFEKHLQTHLPSRNVYLVIASARVSSEGKSCIFTWSWDQIAPKCSEINPARQQK